MRIAQQGDYLINLYTKEIKQAKLVDENGVAIVKEEFHPPSDSPEITTWERYEYVVIPEPVDPSLLE